MKRVLAPFVAVAMAVYIPFRAWRRARRDGTSIAAAFGAMSEDAWEEMSPEMKAEIWEDMPPEMKAERARREAEDVSS